MAGALLSLVDRQHFLALMRRQINSAVHRRINALLLLDDGWTSERVAEALFIDAETVRQHKGSFLASGREGIERLKYVGRSPVLNDEQTKMLLAELSTNFYRTAKQVCRFVCEQCGHTYTPNAMAKLLGRLGMTWKRPKCIPAKANPEKQQAFRDDVLLPLMATAEADPDQPLYFVDATHPSYDAHPASTWLRRGETRLLKSNHGRATVTLNGALRWPSLEVVTRESDKITAIEMIALFEDLVARHPTATAIHIVLDNATYNRANVVKEWLVLSGGKVLLHFLPSYAPNLNLIERLWRFFKEQTLWNIHYPTLAEFKAAIVRFFQTLPDKAEELKSLLTPNFHLIGQQAQISSA